MTKLLLMIVATGGMLAVGWFVWRALQAQEDASPNDTTGPAIGRSPMETKPAHRGEGEEDGPTGTAGAGLDYLD